MKRLLAVFGIAAACAACCAIPLALPLLAGLTASGLGLATFGWEAAGALLVTTGIVGLAVVMRNRKRDRPCLRAAAPASCGCAASTGAAGNGAVSPPH